MCGRLRGQHTHLYVLVNGRTFLFCRYYVFLINDHKYIALIRYSAKRFPFSLHLVGTLPLGRVGVGLFLPTLFLFFLFLRPREYGLSEKIPPRSQISQARACKIPRDFMSIYLHIPQLPYSQLFAKRRCSVVSSKG